MDDDAYVSSENPRRIVAQTALGCVAMFAITVGIPWILFSFADEWPIDARDALVVTAFFFGAAVLVFAVITIAVLTDRTSDRSGVSLVIDRRGVYFGGRPARRFAWSEIRHVAAFLGDRHEAAPGDFWSGTGLVSVCCFEFWPYERPESATTPGRHRVDWTLRRDYESWQEIARVRGALLRYAPTKVARGGRR